MRSFESSDKITHFKCTYIYFVQNVYQCWHLFCKHHIYVFPLGFRETSVYEKVHEAQKENKGQGS